VRGRGFRGVLHNPNATDNITKWAAELAEFELNFVPRHAVKSQVLTNFIVDWTPSASPPGGPNNSEPEPRAPVFTRSTDPRAAWGPVQVYGAPGLQTNQQHGGVRSTTLWVEYNLVAGGSATPHERRLPAHHQTSQGRLLLQ
jgi:hypothetical protein